MESFVAIILIEINYDYDNYYNSEMVH